MKSKSMIKWFQTKTINIADDLTKAMESHGFSTSIDVHGNVICHRVAEEHSYYPLLMAHMDTVHSIDDKLDTNKDVYFDTSKGIFWSPQGLGGDDRNGIIIILELLEKYKGNLAVIFFQDEECGGIGSSLVNADEFTWISYGIAIDRRERNDIIFDACNTKIASNAFQLALKPHMTKHKLRKVDGLFSDAVNVTTKANLSTVNISAGYYSPHTFTEYSKLSDMREIESFILDVLQFIPNNSQWENHEHTAPMWANVRTPSNGYNWKNEYDEWRHHRAYVTHRYGRSHTERFKRESVTDAKCPTCYSWVSKEDLACIWCGDVPDEFIRSLADNRDKSNQDSLFEGGSIE